MGVLEEFSKERGTFIYHFQPIISSDHGRIVDVEALVRFQEKDGTLVPPGAFIPQMEADGSIEGFTRDHFPQLVTAIQQLRQYVPTLRLSFNLASQSLKKSDCSNFLLDELKRQGVPADALQMEILETGVLQQDERVEGNIRKLADAGMAVAMDDYGTGYSSIDTLSLWPFSSIKLDRNLIGRMAESQKATTIVEASIRMAHQLGISVVAEGIETETQYRFLTSAGCDKLQGFWIARPMPIDQLIHFIEENQSHLYQGRPPIGLIIQAQMDHLEWRRQLLQELQSIRFERKSGEPRVAHRLPEPNHRLCRFGRWYYSVDEDYIKWSEFKALREPHREFHQSADQLLDMVRRGDRSDDLEQLLLEMDRKTAEMIELLQQLEIRSFMESITREQDEA
ncbi:MAG: EAL domain-containing protein [Gammaproteobacteria bacterium]|jgi:EAL domain-containing protein (putative c-di-GMP-specific phosphodiesterase class I)|nr:EAL domain-containing protein [Gammaproteobacteria bacterium]MBT4605547.1 EAL domain-containing protein [Thiotrichales bacterium]MBT3473121.1 EAL domain-containing protein [Gammaproteobacteria bacterium]MBT3967340.1 EAL domain-containing protein [Gammaproteobacteria bacterium]MBT4080016.1 EAL domain-containing protein [Gammaproteobacteria bacterium]